MSYHVIEFRGFHYIKGEPGDPPLATNVGPWRFKLDADKVADQLNEKLQPPLQAVKV